MVTPPPCCLFIPIDFHTIGFQSTFHTMGGLSFRGKKINPPPTPHTHEPTAERRGGGGGGEAIDAAGKVPDDGLEGGGDGGRREPGGAAGRVRNHAQPSCGAHLCANRITSPPPLGGYFISSARKFVRTTPQFKATDRKKMRKIFLTV